MLSQGWEQPFLSDLQRQRLIRSDSSIDCCSVRITGDPLARADIRNCCNKVALVPCVDDRSGSKAELQMCAIAVIREFLIIPDISVTP